MQASRVGGGGRSRVVLAARIALSAGLLAFLLTRVHLHALVPKWEHSAVWWLSGGLLLTVVGVVLSTVRWQRALHVLDTPTRLSRLLSHQLAGLFVGNFAPSTVGVDVLRVARLSADTQDRPGAFASVIIERMSGWLVLPVMTLVGLLAVPHLRHLGTATRLAVALSTVTLVALLAVVFVAAHPRLGGRLAGNAGWLRFAGAIHLGLDTFRRHPARAAEVLAVAASYQLAMLTAAWMAAEALGLDLGWTVFLAFFPAVAIAQVVSPVGGLGLREGALVVFLAESPLGVARAQAITLGLLLYAMNLVVSLLGAPSFAVGGKPARSAA
ncbi:MAG: putative integral rane protein [Acidimicrobiales bacterium]|jgi:uncharacterized membrane protein YbhN (UPF0104 family)|nr:putative integral rane protein [Acidimicrobiales bacterium]